MNLLDYLQSLSLKKARLRGDEYVCCCPFHDDTVPSFYFNIKKRVFNCFGCGSSGDLVSFVKKVEGSDWKNVLRKIDDSYVIKVVKEKVVDRDLKKELDTFVDISIVGKKFLQRKIGKLDGIDKFELKCKIVGNRGWIVFPVWDYRKYFIGYVTRLIDYDKKEYKTYGRVKEYLYGEWFLKSEKDLVLVEGVLDVIGLSRYVDNVLGTFGTVLSDEQIVRVKTLVDIYRIDRVNILFDPDESGKREGKNLGKQLKLIGVNVNFLDACIVNKDPKSWTKEDFELCMKR